MGTDGRDDSCAGQLPGEGRSGQVGFTGDEIRELANAFCDPLAGMQLLEAAGLERGRHPAWQASNAEQFWREVSALVASGVLAGGRQHILAEARRHRPANPTFPAGHPVPCRVARHTAGTALLAQPGRVRYPVPVLAATMAVTLAVVSWMAGRATTSTEAGGTSGTSPSRADPGQCRHDEGYRYANRAALPNIDTSARTNRAGRLLVRQPRAPGRR